MIKITHIPEGMEPKFPTNTPEWWFDQMDEPYRSLALEAFAENSFDSYEKARLELSDSLFRALDTFDWSQTAQGDSFWGALVHAVDRGEKWPEPPPPL